MGEEGKEGGLLNSLWYVLDLTDAALLLHQYGRVIVYHKLLGEPTVFVVEPSIIKRVLVTNAKNYPKTRFQTKEMRRIAGTVTGIVCWYTHA